ncbi:MAG: SDR family oxidoreductase [Gemmatimonadetes bacterium]|nr:SDR family oxidoreductase [Gemmatimonadota bacterium]
MNERAAVVTGGAGALGASVVEMLLGDGWLVHVPVRDERQASRVGDRTGWHAHLRVAVVERTDRDAVSAFFARVEASSPRLHLLANLAGGFAAGSVEDTDSATWERMWASNATAPLEAARAAIPLLRAAGGSTIVNVASAAAVGGPVAGMAAYLAAKSALVSLTRSLAEELAPYGVNVNAVAPTVLDTPANRAAMPGADRAGWVSPAEVAEVIRFLAGPAGRVVSGNVLTLRKR